MPTYTVLVTLAPQEGELGSRTELLHGLTAEQIHTLGEDPRLIRLEACPRYLRDRFGNQYKG